MGEYSDDSDDDDGLKLKGKVAPEDIMGEQKRRKLNKIERLEKIKEGREQFESKGRAGGETRREEEEAVSHFDFDFDFDICCGEHFERNNTLLLSLISIISLFPHFFCRINQQGETAKEKLCHAIKKLVEC